MQQFVSFTTHPTAANPTHYRKEGIQIDYKFTNWKRLFIALLILAFLMIHPASRSIILLILPLGSGIDDLFFFAVGFAAFVLLIARAIVTKNIIQKIADWLTR